jgi:uncharacterized protein YkwD
MFLRTVLYVFVFIFIQPVWAEQSPGSQSFQEQVLYYVNKYRVSNHRSPLTMLPIISHQATLHSQEMANKKAPFGHADFNSRIMMLYKEIKGCNGGAENVAYYKMDAKKLVDAWIASPGHRQNILGHYKFTGIGVAPAKKGWGYYTQIFIRTAQG